METVTLKNGAEEVKVLVVAHMLSFERLWDEAPLAVFDLHRACSDPDYEIFSPNLKILKELNLVNQDGTIHSSTRHIVLSAIEGEGLDAHLVSPIAK